jgi:hypothetical protein
LITLTPIARFFRERRLDFFLRLEWARQRQTS